MIFLMKRNGDLDFRSVVKIAGAYMASIMGAGFATGQEILQFFTGQGIMSLWGTLVTTVLLSLMGALFMKHGYERALEEPLAITSFYFGSRFSKAVEASIEVFLYAIFFIMISGFGATLSEFFGWNPWVGRVLITVLVFFSVILGLRRFIDLLGILGPVLIVFTLVSGFCGILKGTNRLGQVEKLLPSLSVIITPGGWFLSGVLYPCFNALTVFYFLCNTGRTAKSEREAFWGGILGGIFLGLAVTVLNLGFLLNLEGVATKEVPSLHLASLVHPVFSVTYSILICVGIYGVTVPTLWSVVRHFGEDGSPRAIVAAAILSVFGLFLSITDFKTLVNVIYPYSGWVGLLLLVLLLAKEFRNRRLER